MPEDAVAARPRATSHSETCNRYPGPGDHGYMEHLELLTTDACTLPTAERPLRLAEFEELFAEHLTDLSWIGDRLRLTLSGGAGLREQVADLAARETACCSFFDFALSGDRPTRSCSTWVSRPSAGRSSTPSPRWPRVPADDARGRAAATTGVNRETLRYYERRGLLARPDRSPGGHRLYPAEAVTRLRVVKAAQRLGFTLDEVRELLDAGRAHGRDARLQVQAREKLVEVRGSPISPRSATTWPRPWRWAATTCTSAPPATAARSRSRRRPRRPSRTAAAPTTGAASTPSPTYAASGGTRSRRARAPRAPGHRCRR